MTYQEFILLPRQTQKKLMTYLNLTILCQKGIDSFPHRRIKTSFIEHTRQTKTRSKFNRLLRTRQSSSWAEPDLYDLPFFVEVGLRPTMIVAGKIPSLVAYAIVAGEILSFGGQFLGKFRLIPRRTPAGG